MAHDPIAAGNIRVGVVDFYHAMAALWLFLITRPREGVQY